MKPAGEEEKCWSVFLKIIPEDSAAFSFIVCTQYEEHTLFLQSQ